MKEQIEKDRESLRSGTQSNSGFSYIPLLKAQESVKNKVKLSKLNTVNILIYLEEGFQINDKYVLNHIERFKKEILSRPDLLDSILKYLQNKKVRDDLFYWTPGYKISNIFSFIADMVPNFPKLYKEYYIEKMVCRREVYDALNFIKEKFGGEYDQFRLMAMDLYMFNSCITVNNWIDDPSIIGIKHDQILHALEIPKKIDISADIEANLVTDVSFVDVSINGADFTVKLDPLLDLLSKGGKYQDYWSNLGVQYDFDFQL